MGEYNKVYPRTIEIILQHYYELQENNKERILSEEQRQNFVGELINAYNSLSKSEKCDVLVPANWKFLKEHAISSDQAGSKKYIYSINYKWPPNNGFADSFEKITLLPGQEYDRVGGPKGRFIAPLNEDGSAVSFLARAIPYYIPELNVNDSPAYHRYRVISAYRGVGSGDMQSVLQGKIASAFWHDPDDGGATQVKLPLKVYELKDVLYEI